MGKRRRLSSLRFGTADKIKLASIAVALALTLVLFVWWLPRSTTSDAEESRIPAFFESEAQAAPLPVTLKPELFREAMTFRAYQIAQKIPSVLAQQPCYCHCDRGAGHRSLLDCYRDRHGAECLICTREAVLAGRLHNEGVPPPKIRESIIRGDWRKIDVSH
jgi:hypothetical protein